MKKEFRVISSIESDERADTDTPEISGYAAVFNQDADIAGLFTESIKPGAFKRSLEQSDDIKALFNHDTAKVLGATKNNSLELSEDSNGLKFRLAPNLETSTGKDVYELVKRGDVDKMSFGFYIVEDRWSTKDGRDHREILEADLFEVSVVTFPAYSGTSAQARSAEEIYNEHKEKQQAEAEAENKRKESERIKKQVKSDLKKKELDVLADRCL